MKFSPPFTSAGRRLAIVIGLLIGAHEAVADAALVDSLEKIFRPFDADQVALSPSGRYVAYTTRKSGNLILTVRDFEANTVRKIVVGVDAAEPLSGAHEAQPAGLTFLRWAAGDRLVFNLNTSNVWSIAADFSHRQFLSDAKRFDLITPESAETKNPSAVHPEMAYLPNNVQAPSSLSLAVIRPQSIDIVGMPFGGQFVYLASTRVDSRGRPAVSHRYVFRVDTATGEEKELADVENATGIIHDRDGQPRLYTDLHTRQRWYRDPEGKWTEFAPLMARVTGPGGLSAANDLRIGSPIGFDSVPWLFYAQAGVGADRRLVAIDTRTWSRTNFDLNLAGQMLAAKDPLFFDDSARKLVGVRITAPEPRVAWIDPDFEGAQKALDATSPKRQWDILESSATRQTFLAFESATAEPGTYCLFRPQRSEVVEFMNIAPWLGAAEKNESATFSFMTTDGHELIASLTQPWQKRLKVPPLVVLCANQRFPSRLTGYQREAQALARMGYAVLQVQYRPSRFRGAPNADSDALAPDAIALDDILTAIDSLPPGQADRRFTAIVGRDYGGYLALRAMQLHPDRFRCAVAINAPTDLSAIRNAPALKVAPPMQMRSIDLSNEFGMTVEGQRGFVAQPLSMAPASNPSTARRIRIDFSGLTDAELREFSPATHPERFKGPILLLESDSNTIFGGKRLASALQKRIPETTFVSLNADEAAPLPRAQAALFAKMDEFLTANIYNYAVKIGAMQIVENEPKPPKPEAPAPVRPDAPMPTPQSGLERPAVPTPTPLR
jgi:dipeptidyl aminopeptidase/acylaminoacyl peptidase